MCGQTCDQFVDSSTKTISLYMVCILVGLVHIYSLESTVKRESCRIFARNDIKINFLNEHAWQSAACRHKILTSGKEMRCSIIDRPKCPKRSCQSK